MRSRYCAFALHFSDYIIKTTHQNNPDYTTNINKWKQSIEIFCQNTQFIDLKILGHTQNHNEAFVTFHAILEQNGVDVSFTEKSRFYKVANVWLYESGEFLE